MLLHGWRAPKSPNFNQKNAYFFFLRQPSVHRSSSTGSPCRQWPTSFRDREAEGFGGLEVDDEFELAHLHDRQIGGFSPHYRSPAGETRRSDPPQKRPLPAYAGKGDIVSASASRSVTNIQPGACVIASSGFASIIAACVVTPQAQNTGTSPARTLTASPKSGRVKSAIPIECGSPK
jgi:hypothetical protein